MNQRNYLSLPHISQLSLKIYLIIFSDGKQLFFKKTILLLDIFGFKNQQQNSNQFLFSPLFWKLQVFLTLSGPQIQSLMQENIS